MAAQLNMVRVQVTQWRERDVRLQCTGIERYLPGGAQPAKEGVVCLVELATQHTPRVPTHGRTGVLAGKSEAIASAISRRWRFQGLKYHRVRGFRASRIVGLYLSPPEHALVRCCDGRSRVQALDRTWPGLSLKKGRAPTLTRDGRRRGTNTRFAAFYVSNGEVAGQCRQRPTHAEWLKFPGQINRGTPKTRTLRLIADNTATTRHPVVPEGLATLLRFPHVVHAAFGRVAERGGAILPRQPRRSPVSRGVRQRAGIG